MTSQFTLKMYGKAKAVETYLRGLAILDDIDPLTIARMVVMSLERDVRLEMDSRKRIKE